MTVDSDGKVTSATGYTTPADGDSNGKKDFLEVGSGVSITRQPHVYVAEADDTVKYTVLHTTQGTVTYQWQESRNSGSTWTDLSETTVYNNVTTNILTVNKVTSTMDEYLYRAIIKTPAYACQDSVVTENARLIVTDDFDQDGIVNSVDLDDDNDGILDTEEGEGDLDDDGYRNRFDLDSDADGCYDVTEAGFIDNVSDATGDGILGDNKPYAVDSEGKITTGVAGDGYTTPADLDNNGIKDYLQNGSNILILADASSLTMMSSGTG